MPGHDAPQPCGVGDHGAGEASAVGEARQPRGGVLGGRAGQVMLVAGGHGHEVFPPGECLLGFDLGAEAGVAGA
ncbi:hypothetical protein [Amycolatopsis sp. WAC 01375]|uniref:hypothetical protein n=1 Tax=Amycolatopsis sp. WAC 01375 TaxID=2203194 RepID=UPI0013158618|nr:hypothetical protein [Amycolatopsis sp. WAC 01375]